MDNRLGKSYCCYCNNFMSEQPTSIRSAEAKFPLYVAAQGRVMMTRTLWAMLAGSVALAPLAAQAQSAAAAPAESAAAQPDEGIADIVVTAERRATSVQDTPLAVSAVSGDNLRGREINTLENLAPSLPNVNFGKNVGFARVAIRGVGLDTTVAGQEGRVAVHTDGVYISRPSAAISSFFDVDRVEVVRGPQGTLYGRNATGGAINVITNDPKQEFGGYARLTAGNYGLVASEGAITGPVSDTLSARFAYTITRRGGYGKNLLDGSDIDDDKEMAIRGKLRFAPTANFDITLAADYFQQDDNAFVYHFLGRGSPTVVPFGTVLGGRVAANPRDMYSETDQINTRRFYGFSAIANLDLGAATLTSITAYRSSKLDYQSDADGTDALVSRFQIQEDADQFSQELRLGGTAGRLKWVVGAYYFSEDIFANNAFRPMRRLVGPTPLAQGVDYRGDMTTRAYAVFGQADYELVDRLSITVGARYSSERKGIDSRGVVDFVTPYNATRPLNYNQFQDDSVRQSSFTPRLGVQFKPNDDVMLYATYAKGFKSGGYAVTSIAPPLRPEKLTDYEGGIKAEWFDRRLRTNLSAFYYDYADLQVQKIDGAAAIPLNAAQATVKGVELEFVAKPVSALELSGNISYLDATFDSFVTGDTARPALGNIDLAGNRLQQAPKYTVNLAAAYRVPVGSGSVTLRGEMNYVDRVFFSFYNRPEVSQPANTKYNAFLNYAANGDGLNASLWVRNLTNRRTVSSSQVSAGFVGFPIMGAFDPPRTYGVTFGITF